MNPIYRVVFNAVTGVWQAVSETARGRSKSSRSTSRAWSRRMAVTAATRLDNPPSPVPPLAWAARIVATGIGASLMASGSAYAACTSNNTIVNCDSSTNTPTYVNQMSGLTLNIANGAVITVPQTSGDNAVTLNGSGITVNNLGTIGPSLSGGRSLAAAGLVVGNGLADNSAIVVNNKSDGQIKGVFDDTATLLGFGGQALVAQNVNGTTTIDNDGLISMSLIGSTGSVSDAITVVTYGGAAANVTNKGTIEGRVGLGASGGNTFLNAGIVSGSVHLGNSTGGNTFTAVSGSSVVAGGGTASAGAITGVTGVKAAAAGTVDAGSGSGAANNKLVLQNSTLGLGSGTGGAVTTVDWSQYLNFQQLTIHSGTWNLQGAWSGTGTTTLNDGLVNFNNATSFGTGPFTANGGAIASSTANLNLANAFSLGGNLTLAGTNAFGLGGVLSGSGSLTVNNTGIVTLGGANTFTGGVSLNAGGLVLGNAKALGDGTLTVGGSASLDTTAGFTLTNNLVVNSGGSLNLLGSNALTWNGSISGAGNVTKKGAGTLTLNGANSLTGNFNLAGGALALGAGGSLSPNGAITMAVGTSLDLSAGGNQIIGSLAGLGGSVNLGSKTLTFAGLGNTSYSGTFAAGTGGLVKLGTGVQTLSGVNNFSGGMALNAGGLVLGHAAALGSGALSVGGSTTLDGTTALALANKVNLGSGASLNLLGSQALTLGGVIAGSGSLVKNGTSTLTLNGANTFSGGLALNAGGLMLGNAGALGTGALNVGGVVTLDAGSALSVGNDINLGAGSRLNVLGSNALTLGGAIAGSGSLVKNGAATLTLGGANTFTGGLTINAGQVALGSGASLAAGGAVSLAGAGADLDISLGGNQTIGALSGVAGSTVTLGSRTLTFGDATNQTFAGVIGGTGGLVKQGMGIQTLSGGSIFSGGVMLNAGGLLLGNAAALGGGTLTVGGSSSLDSSAALTLTNAINLGAALTLPGSQNLTLNGNITGTGSLTKNGTSTLTLNGANTFSGGLALQGGGLILGHGTALGSGALNVGGNATLDGTSALSLANAVNLGSGSTLTLQGGHNLTLSGAISGSGGLVKNGNGPLTLEGANTYSGGTTIAGGTLALNGAGSLGSGLVTNNGLLDFQSSSGTLTLGNAISGTGTVQQSGSGATVLTGANSYTGTTTVTAGTLMVNGSLASATVNVANGGTLGGSGSLAGAVTVTNGATLAPGASTGNGPVTGSLSVGSLTMNQGSTLAVALGAPGANFQTLGQGSSVSVTGNLALNGAALDVRNAGGFGPGLYRLFDYGTLTNYSLTTSTAGFSVQHLVSAKQINLISTQGMVLNFWNADGLASSTAQGGGTGTWSSTAPLWTDATGSLTSTMSPQPGFAIFAGAAGTVTVDGSAAAVQATGLQFASNGYQLTGGALTLVADANHIAPVEVRVGDGSAASSAWTATLTNEIAGSDGLKKTGAGTLVLAGANSYSGGTTVAAGTLSVGQDRNLGAAGADVTLNGGTLQITGTGFANSSARNWLLGSAGGGIDIAAAGHSFTLGNALAGTGSLSKTGAGTLVLTGANSYSGGTTIGGGTLALGAGSTLAATGAVALMASGASFDISGANTAQTIAALQGVAGSGMLLGANALTFGDATSTSFDGAFSGSGALTKQGSGTLTLAGDSSGFAGSTTIHGGTLALAATAQLGGALTLASGATLTGTGTVGTKGSLGNPSTLTRVQSGATVAPGDATHTYGTLQVAGDLEFAAGSTYRVQADPASNASSRIDVGGSATLAGGVLHVGNPSNAATDFQLGQSYTILHASQITGTFDSVKSNYGYLDPTLRYSASDVTLQLERKPSGGGTIGFADLAESSNQAGVANGIESLGSGDLYNHVLHLPNGAPAAFFSQVSGDMHASVGGSLPSLGAFAPSISQQHLRSNMTAGMYLGAPVAQSDGPLPASAWPSSKALPAWAEVVGHWQTFDGDGNAAQLKQRTTGIFLGMDQEVGTSGWRLGGSVGYTNADGKVADRASESDVNSYSAAVYGGKSFGTGTGPRINVLGGLAYTWHDIETTRKVESLGQTLKADYSAHTAQLFAEVGYAIGQYDAVGVEPFFGVNVGTQRTRGFQEGGGFAALQGASSSDDLASTTLGVRVHSDFQLAGKEGRLRATLGWRHALGDVAQSKTMAFEGGQNFTVAGSPLARNTALLGLEADVALSRSAALVLGYQGELASGQRDHSANVKLRWAF